MKIRTILLVACIVVVPLIAMFSHRVPPGTRHAMATWVREWSRAARPAAVAPVVAAPLAPPPPATTVQHAAPAPPAEAGPPVVPVAAVAPAPDITSGVAGMDGLRALGAIAIECRPMDGSAGYVATCRVPVDGDGQLQRVFQATGADAAAAADNLLRDVRSWTGGATSGPRRTLRF